MWSTGHPTSVFTALTPLTQVGGKVPTPNGGPDADPEQVEGFVTASFDLDEIRTARARYAPFWKLGVRAG